MVEKVRLQDKNCWVALYKIDNNKWKVIQASSQKNGTNTKTEG